jgi:hypothetical protein
MPKKYCLAILLMCSAGIPVAEAAQKDKPTNAIDNGGTNQVSSSATNSLSDQPMFKFGGFGTLGLSHSSLNLGDYILDSTMPKGTGRSSEWSSSNNSKIAAHLNASFTPKVSAVLQVISEYHADGTYRPEVEWLNVKYSFNPNAYVRAGRIALPTFMNSENRDVGYSYIWVYPPVDLYHQQSIPSSDGIDAMYRFEIGEASNSVKAIFGRNTLERPTSITTSNDMWGIFDNLEYDETTLHLGYQERMSSTQSATAPPGVWNKNKDLSVGASYDPGNWFVMSEWMQRRSTYKVGAMYASAGYRINKFTPYLIHSQNSRGSFLQASPAPTATLLLLADRSQSTNSLGARWDFMRNYDLKVQYDRITLSDSSNGYLINVPANITLYGTTFHVISAVVDFVF